MANEVKVIFSAEGDGLFRVADQVETRLRSVAAEAEKLNINIGRSGRDFQLAPKIAAARAETARLGDQFATLGDRIKPGVGEFSRLLSLIPTSTLAISAVGVASIAAAKLASDRYRELADLRLKREERITAELNKQILATREQTAEFERQEEIRRGDRAFSRQLGASANNIPALRAEQQRLTNELSALRQSQQAERLALTRSPRRIETQGTTASGVVDWAASFLGVRPVDRSSGLSQKQYDAQSAALDQRQRAAAAVLERRLSAANEALEAAQIRGLAGFQNNRSNINQKSAAQELKEWMDEVKKGKDRVKELGEQWKSVFDEAFARANSNNPFVSIYSDATAAVERFTQQTVGLNKELRQQGLLMIAMESNRKLLGARVDSALRAFDLRETAARFREGGGVSRNIRLADAIDANNEPYQRRLQQYQNDVERSRRTGIPLTYAINDQAIRESIKRRQELSSQLRQNDANLSAQERLDRRLNVLSNFRPRNASEQAVLDSRVLGIAGGLDPSSLREDQRNSIAAAAERQAEREARQNEEALKSHRQRELYLKDIRDRLDGLSQGALSGGINAVNKLLVEVKDETEAGVNVRSLRQPTPSDVDLNYGTFGGGGGLTSF